MCGSGQCDAHDSPAFVSRLRAYKRARNPDIARPFAILSRLATARSDDDRSGAAAQLESIRQWRVGRRFAESHQREMSERGHRPALDQVDAILARGPLRESRPRELGAPAELARDRLKPGLDGP